MAMMTRVLGATALLIAYSAAAAAQTNNLVPGDRDASAQLAKIVETTRAAGLPSDPILGMVSKGVMTHTPPARIVDAAHKIAARLQVAREALGPNASNSDIEAASNAIGEGADGNALRAIRDASRNRPLAVPLGVLTQLLGEPLKTPLKQATQIVKDFIGSGATSAQLVAFTNDLNADVAAGMPRQSAVDARVRLLSAVLSPAGSAAAGFAQDLSAAAAPGVRSGPPKRP